MSPPLSWSRRQRMLQGLAWSALSLGRSQAAEPGLANSTALVLGNGAYPRMPLRNAVNDARLMARTLSALGYETRLVEDADLMHMTQAVQQWLGLAGRASSRIFFFAGHGVQVRGRNYLLPIDARPTAEEDIDRQALQAQELIDRLARFEQGANLLILDACRNVPNWLVPPALSGRAATQPWAAGLAPVAAPRGTLVAYSTSPGAVAMDGGAAGNSLYTRHLSEAMQQAGSLPVELMFKRVRLAVLQESQRAQTPWETSSLVGDFCLRPDPAGRCLTDAPLPPAAAAMPGASVAPSSGGGSAIDLRKLRR